MGFVAGTQQGTARAREAFRALRASLALALLLLVAGSAAAQTPATLPESPLVIESGDKRFTFQVEVADTHATRAQGLMFREELAADRGMLFDFDVVRPVSMWMRNTYVSLDMLFLDEGGRITHIAPRTEPLSEATISSNGPVRAVLELRGGVTALLGIEEGDRVLHPVFGNADEPTPAPDTPG